MDSLALTKTILEMRAGQGLAGAIIILVPVPADQYMCHVGRLREAFLIHLLALGKVFRICKRITDELRRIPNQAIRSAIEGGASILVVVDGIRLQHVRIAQDPDRYLVVPPAWKAATIYR